MYTHARTPLSATAGHELRVLLLLREFAQLVDLSPYDYIYIIYSYTVGIFWVALLGPRSEFSSLFSVSSRSSRASQSHMYNNPYAAVMAVTGINKKPDFYVAEK